MAQSPEDDACLPVVSSGYLCFPSHGSSYKAAPPLPACLPQFQRGAVVVPAAHLEYLLLCLRGQVSSRHLLLRAELSLLSFLEPVTREGSRMTASSEMGHLLRAGRRQKALLAKRKWLQRPLLPQTRLTSHSSLSCLCLGRTGTKWEMQTNLQGHLWNGECSGEMLALNESPEASKLVKNQ